MDQHAIVVAGTDGVIQAWSRGAERPFGYPVAEAVGQTLDLIVPESFRDRHWRGFRAVMSGGLPKMEGASANLPVLCGSGEVEYFPGRLSVLRDARGEIVGAMAIYRPSEGTDNGLYTLEAEMTSA